MFGTKRIPDLRTLYLDELKDAYDFEHQLLDALPKMQEAARHAELEKAFREHLDQTKQQVDMLEQVFGMLEEPPERKTCQGMKGLIKEGDEFLKAQGDEAAVDAALIGAAQRVEHYEMAAYGTLRTFASTLGHDDQAALLQKILDQESKTDERLTRIAERRINAKAARPDEQASTEATRDELYERAQKLGIEGRSKMSKKELAKAVERST